jgi:hypothetical protein
MIDDWGGKTLGADEPVSKPPVKKKSSTTGLVAYFRDATISNNMTLNAPVNGMALMKVFKNLQEKDVTIEQIYKMIDVFAHEIKQTPLPTDVPTWKGFASRLDVLKKKVDTPLSKYDYSEYTVDKRLMKGTHE